MTPLVFLWILLFVSAVWSTGKVGYTVAEYDEQSFVGWALASAAFWAATLSFGWHICYHSTH